MGVLTVVHSGQSMWVTSDGSESFAQDRLFRRDLLLKPSIFRWWLRDKVWNEPSGCSAERESPQRRTVFSSRGDYHANCFLHIYQFADASNIHLNDAWLQSTAASCSCCLV